MRVWRIGVIGPLAACLLLTASSALAGHAYVGLDIHVYVDHSLPLRPRPKADTDFMVEALTGLRAELRARARDLPQGLRADNVRVTLFADRVDDSAIWHGTFHSPDAGKEPDAWKEWEDRVLDVVRRSNGDTGAGVGLQQERTDFVPVFQHIQDPKTPDLGYPVALIISNGVVDTGQGRPCEPEHQLKPQHRLSRDEYVDLQRAIQTVALRTALLLTPCDHRPGELVFPFWSAWQGFRPASFEAVRSHAMKHDGTANRPEVDVKTVITYLENGVVAVTQPEAVSVYGRRPATWVAHTDAKRGVSAEFCLQQARSKRTRFDLERDVFLEGEDGRYRGKCVTYDIKRGRAGTLPVTLYFSSAKVEEMLNDPTSGLFEVDMKVVDSPGLRFRPSQLTLNFDFRPGIMAQIFLTRWAVPLAFWIYIAAIGLLMVAAAHRRFGLFALGWDVECEVHEAESTTGTPPPLTAPLPATKLSWLRSYAICPKELLDRHTGRLPPVGQRPFPLKPADSMRFWPLGDEWATLVAARGSRIAWLEKYSANVKLDVSTRQHIGRSTTEKMPPIFIGIREEGKSEPKGTGIGLLIRWEKRLGLMAKLQRSVAIEPFRWLKWTSAVCAGLCVAYLVSATAAAWYYELEGQRGLAWSRFLIMWMVFGVMLGLRYGRFHWVGQLREVVGAASGH